MPRSPGAKLLGYFLAAVAVVVVVDRLSDAKRRSVLIWAAVGLVTADLIVWLDVGMAGALSGLFKQAPFSTNFYSRGAAISACALLPIAVGLFRMSGSRQAFVFAAISLATVLVLANEAARLAAVLGVLVYVAVRWRGVLFWPVILLPWWLEFCRRRSSRTSSAIASFAHYSTAKSPPRIGYSFISSAAGKFSKSPSLAGAWIRHGQFRAET